MPRKSRKNTRAVTRQSDATKVLLSLGAKHREDKRAGITVTGKLKDALRENSDKRIVSAVKFTANTAAKEADKLFDRVVQRVERIDDKTTQRQAQEFLSKYAEHLQSIDRALSNDYRSLRVINRLEDLSNYNVAAYKILRNATAFFEERKYGAISGILNNLMGTYKREIPPDDLKKLLQYGDELGLNTVAEMDRAYSEYDALLRNSDQIGEVLTEASSKLQNLIKGNDKFIEEHKEAYDKFTELASKYGLW